MKALAALSVALAAAVFALSGSGAYAQQQFARSCPLLTFDQSVDGGAGGGGVRFRFAPTSQPAPEWVEVHYGITAPNAFNFKMIRNGNAWEHADPSLRLSGGDAMRYWFTYYAVGQQCDTEQFAWNGAGAGGNAALMGGQFRPMNVQALSSGYGAAPAAPLMAVQPMMAAPQMPRGGGGTCPAIQFRQSAAAGGQGVRFTFESADGSPLSRVELHYGLAGQPTNSVNLRMKSVSPSQWEFIDTSITQPAGLKYWFSYDTGSIACDTDIFTFGGAGAAPQALMQQQFIPVTQPLQSGYGQQPAQALQQFAALSTPPAAAASAPVRGGAGMCPATQFRQSAQAGAQGVRFVFESLDNTLLQRVDLHYGLAGQPTNAVNTRMRAVGSAQSQWEFIDTSIRGDQLNGLKYWFTYSTGAVDCDTDVFTAGSGVAPQALVQQPFIPVVQPLQSGYGQQPQPLMAIAPQQPRAAGGSCPAIQFRQTATAIGQGVRFTFESADGSPLSRVELHYGLAGQPTNSVNLRMKSVSPSQWEFVETSIPQPAGLKYWFAYDTGSTACDTDTFTFGGAAPAPQALLQQPFIPVTQPLQSAYGAAPAPIAALTAAPSGGGGTCPAITFEQKLVPTDKGLRWQFRSTDGTALRNVDLHFGLNDQPKNAVNVKMRSQSPSVWTHHDSSVSAGANDRVTYWFTYNTGAVDCDTDVFTFGGGQAPQALTAAPAQSYGAAPAAPVPAPQPIMAAPAYGAPAVAPLQAGRGTCPSLQFQQSVSGGQFTFTGLNGVAQWVDAHWGLAGQPINSMNVRMKSADGGKTWTHADPSLAAGANGMRWYFTYNANGVDCDTEQFGGAAPQALTAAASYAPAPAPQPIMAAPAYSAPALAPASAPIPQAIMAATAPAYGAPAALTAARSCPSLQFQQSIANGQFTFAGIDGVAQWVDAHWGLAGQPINSMNVRMRSADGGKTWTHSDPSLGAGVIGMRWYFTYNANGVDCDTEQFGGAAPQALAAAPSYAAAPAPQPIMAAPAPTYAPAPQPIMAAPAYAAPVPAPAPQAIMAAPAAAYGAPAALAARTCPSLQFQQSVANGQFTFAGIDGVAQWVDVHWGLAGQPVNSMNVRMKSADGGKTWIHADPSLAAGASGLRYYFTYNANGVDCDTEIFGAAAPQALTAAPSYAPAPAPQPIMAAPAYAAPAPAPQPIMAAPAYSAPAPAPQPLQAYAPGPQPLRAGPMCPYIQFQQSATPGAGGLQFSFVSLGGNAAFVDVHYGVSGQPPTAINARMKSADGGKSWTHVDPTVLLGAGASVKYFFTYCVDHVDCDTEVFTFGVPAPQPLMTQPLAAAPYAPAPQPVMAAPYSAPQPVRAAPTYSAPAPQPLAAAPSYSAPAPQPIMAAPSYAPAPQPIMAAPAYSAPQPLQAPASSAPYTAPIHSTTAQLVRTVPLETPPAYAPAPQPLAAAPSYSAPAPQPLAAAAPAPAPAPLPVPAAPTAFAALPIATAAPLVGGGFGHGHGFGGGFGGHFCPITGRPLGAFPPAPIGLGTAALPVAPLGVGAIGAAPLGVGAVGGVGAAPLLGAGAGFGGAGFDGGFGGAGFGAGGFDGAGFGGAGFGGPGFGGPGFGGPGFP